MLQETLACGIYVILYWYSPINEQNNEITVPLQLIFDSEGCVDELFIYVNNKKEEYFHS